MPAITVVICCANVQDTLEAACRSAAWADELLIVDSGSTDRTPEIARRHATRYILEPWRGYTEQKKFAAEQAANPWIFVLDGDEEVTPELAEEIRRLSDAAFAAADVMAMPRRHYVMNRPVRSWWPDWQDRLIHRDRARWADEALHDQRRPGEPGRLRRLRSPILHKRTSAAAFSDYFSGRRMDERLLMVARQMHSRGKRCTAADLVLRPPMAFLKSYVIKRGFLDGSFGLLIAQKASVSAQLKYAALWAVQNGCDSVDYRGASESRSRGEE